MNLHQDLTSLWCDLVFAEFYRLGIRHICLAPGSRSAPLALAAERHQQLTIHSHFDERGLGFFALGLARESDTPVVVVTTSGTAVANLSPAVQEARESGVRLLLLTADRPPELLGCGANQTLTQPGIFGEAVARTLLLPVPDQALPVKWLLQILDEAVAILKRPDNYVVHINQALRDPLYGQGTAVDDSEWLKPIRHWFNSDAPLCHWLVPENAVLPLPVLNPEQPVLSLGKVVLLAGQLRASEAAAVAELVERSGWLLVADIQSGLHGHPLALACADMTVAAPAVQTLMSQADLVIQIGRRVLGKQVNNWLAQCAVEHWYVDERSDRHDPNFSVTRRISMAVQDFCGQLLNQPVAQNLDYSWRDTILTMGEKVSTVVHSVIDHHTSESESLTEIQAIRAFYMSMSTERGRHNLFVGNSMPVRYLDSLTNAGVNTDVDSPWQPVWANRGISGIDGLMATASGHSVTSSGRTVILIGDLSFLHDLNSLALVSRYQLVVVLLNNSGGSIFNLFPVPEPVGARCFRVEHNLRAKGAAQMFDLDYQRPTTQSDFLKVLQKALDDDRGTVIEVCVPPSEGTDQFMQLRHAINELAL